MGALGIRFFMDELLALSAAHRSTLAPDAARREVYLAEAARTSWSLY